MTSFDRTIIDQVVAACQAGLIAAAEAISRTIGEPVELSEPKAESLDLAGLPTECRGPALVLGLRVDGEWALVLLPQLSGLVPPWCLEPDSVAREKLVGLAVELGKLFVPQPLTVTEGLPGYVGDLESALPRASLSPESARIAMQIRSGDKSGVVSLIWPASQADAMLREPAPSPSAQSEPSGSPSAQPASASNSPPAPQKRQIQYKELEDGILQLPAYSRSLLKIKVPVMVTLAESKQPVENVLAIGPGSIIHFNKPCEDSLALEIDGQKVALGEAVKVGDKFGLWITSMILPEERFWVLSNRPQSERAK